MFSNAFAGLTEWYRQPYSPAMSVPGWLLFVGLILLALAMWKIIVWHLMDA